MHNISKQKFSAVFGISSACTYVTLLHKHVVTRLSFDLDRNSTANDNYSYKMKRACPYDVNLLRMSKVHLMDHDIDETALHKLHEDTIRKLKEGARNAMTTLVPELIVSPPVSVNPRPMRQMEVTSYFNCEKSYAGNGSAKEEIFKMNVHEEERTICSYCEKKTETYPCGHCNEFFCTSCCLSKYDMKEDQHICLSCS